MSFPLGPWVSSVTNSLASSCTEPLLQDIPFLAREIFAFGVREVQRHDSLRFRNAHLRDPRFEGIHDVLAKNEKKDDADPNQDREEETFAPTFFRTPFTSLCHGSRPFTPLTGVCPASPALEGGLVRGTEGA